MFCDDRRRYRDNLKDGFGKYYVRQECYVLLLLYIKEKKTNRTKSQKKLSKLFCKIVIIGIYIYMYIIIPSDTGKLGIRENGTVENRV